MEGSFKIEPYDIPNTLKYIVKDPEFSEWTDLIIDKLHDELHITKETGNCLKKAMTSNNSVSEFYVQTIQRLEKFNKIKAKIVSHCVYAIISIEFSFTYYKY